MGSSKKHKDRERDKEHKKKKRHRSRSRSRERHSRRDSSRRHKRGHSEDGDVTAGAPPPSRPKEEQRDINDEGPPAGGSSGGGDLSLTLEETNRLRAKLGLKPLEINAETSKDGTAKEDEDVHVPAVNLRKIKESQVLKEKLAAAKERRKIQEKLSKVKTLGDSDEEESVVAWVKRSRHQQQEREMAAKRAKVLEEMDQEFGISDLVEEEFGTKKAKEYSSRDLRGLRVEHAQDSFKEGQTVILTLQDKGVLDEEGGDTLINVNMVDDAKAAKNIENKKKKPDYKPYDEPEYDEYGMLKSTEVLDKYDEEIYGQKKEYIELGSGGKYDAEHERRMQEIKREIRQQGQTLELPAPVLANEFYSQEEMAGTFKKVKKKVRKIRKKPKVVKAEDLIPLKSSGEGRGPDWGTRGVYTSSGGQDWDLEMAKMTTPLEEDDENEALPGDVQVKQEPVDTPAVDIPGLDITEQSKMQIDEAEDDEEEDLGPVVNLNNVDVEEDQAGLELQSFLTERIKTQQKKRLHAPENVAVHVEPDSDENMEEDKDKAGASIAFNATSEFCRSLGDIPTYGMAGNRDEEKEDMMDLEKELLEERKKKLLEEEARAGWTEVEIDTKPVDIKEDKLRALDDEPVVNQGIGAALLLAHKKGYLEKEFKKAVKAPKHVNLEAKSYTIEDKRYDDLDEKYRKRDRYIGGVTMDFKELDKYKPDVKLEYIDDSGRMLNAKEAFRQLSHRFHGKGSGKKKTEKRQKKLEEEQLMKMMSSTDTPLNTVSLLQEKQKIEKSPYILLSGSKSFTSNSGSLSKH